MEVDFKRKNLLGSGAYGSVYKCTFNGKACALKRYIGVRKNSYWSQTAIREIVCLSSMPLHKNIIRLIYAQMTPHGGYLVFPRFSSSLYTYIKHDLKCYVKPDLVLKWSAQLLSAVSHMHKNGFMHRDIKLENVLIDENENVVLADVGMARYYKTGLQEPSVQLSKTVCSLWTRPPELFLGFPYDEKIDLWSLGCVMLAIAAGKYVFRNETRGDPILPSIFAILGCPNDKCSKNLALYGIKTKQEKINSLKKTTCRDDLPVSFYETLVGLLEIDEKIRNTNTENWANFIDSGEKITSSEYELRIESIIKPKLSLFIPFFVVEVSNRIQIGKWIRATCITLKINVSTALLSFLLWLQYSKSCKDFTDAVIAAACCSLMCKLNEVKCYPSSIWAKSVGAKISLLLDAENFVLRICGGNIIGTYDHSADLSALYSSLLKENLVISDKLLP